MQPLKVKLGSLPKPALPAPAPGAPAPVGNTPVRPGAVGSQATVKSPKAKHKNIGMVKSDVPMKGVSKLRSFMDNRAIKKSNAHKK